MKELENVLNKIFSWKVICVLAFVEWLLDWYKVGEADELKFIGVLVLLVLSKIDDIKTFEIKKVK